MLKAIGIAAVFSLAAGAAHAQALNDAQIAHIAYTAGVIDIAAGKQALARSHNKAVLDFAHEMVRDHGAVNDHALALVKKLGVTPQDNPISQDLSRDAAVKLKAYATLKGAAFDRAYVANEVAYHQTVNGALAGTLIPAASNADLKSLLQTGLALFQEHQVHAEHLSASLNP